MSSFLKTAIAAITAMAVPSLAGCASTPPAKGALATLSAPSPKTIAELETIVSKAMNGTPVKIAPDALNTRSTLFIERSQNKGLNGQYPVGRRFDKPDHFTLSLSGNKCVLTHEETGLHYFVTTAQCKPVG